MFLPRVTIVEDEFQETDHPRGEGGKFASKGGGGGTSAQPKKPSPEASKAEGGASEKGKIASPEAQKAGIAGLKGFLKQVSGLEAAQYRTKGMSSPHEFVLRNGRPYRVNDKTYEGKRGTMHQCYRNAAQDAISHPDRTYVEGYISVHGIPIEHAWTVDKSGQVFDSTVKPSQHIEGYYGVPFSREYLFKSITANKVYGLLSGGGGTKTYEQLLKGDIKFRPEPEIYDSLARENMGDTSQPVKSVDELYERAKQEEPGFIKDLDDIAALTGGEVVLTPEEFAEPGTRLKSRKSAERKLKDELGGDATQLRDVMRGTIVNDTVTDTRKSAVEFLKKYEDRILRVKDRFVDDLGGYRDILINYRTEGGLVAEVQFNSKNLLAAKFGEGHRYYEKFREIMANETRTPAQEAEITELNNKQLALYDKAYKADGNGNWALG